MVSRKPWTLEQFATLIQDYRTKGAAFVAAQVGKSETAVRIKACRSGESRLFHARTPRGKRVLNG